MKSKHLLLMGCALVFGISANAQVAKPINPKYVESSKHFPGSRVADKGVSSQAPVVKLPASHRTAPSKNKVSAVSVIPVSTAPNSLTCANNSRSNINYNKDLNSVVLIHRGNPSAPTNSPTGGCYYYDISTDGGANWTLDQGPVYSDPVPLTDKLGTYRGRYPVSDIYNLPGNTDPASAYVVSSGPWTGITTPPSWRGKVTGVGKLNNTGNLSSVDQVNSGFIENMFITKTGTAWRIGSDYNGTSDAYIGTLDFSAGTLNTGTGNFDWKQFHFANPVDMTNFGGVPDVDIAFSDDGMTGYIVVITNNDAPGYNCFQDTTSYLTVFKTTDGGNTWSSNIDLNLSKTPDGLLNNGPSYSYSSGVDLDVVVDANKNLHILTGIHVSAGYSYYYTPGTWGMFDIYTTDQGTTWNAELLDQPETYTGLFGNGVGNNSTLNEYMRPFASRTDDGTKLFFSWFDTDTLLFSGVGNTQPNLHTKGYDLTSGKWTAAMDLTSGTDADGLCTFGNGSYYAIDNGTSYGIPVFFQSMVDINSTGVPTQLNYIDGAVVNASDFTVTGNPISIPVSTCTVIQPPQSFTIGLPEISDPNHLSISGNYPNPFSGTTTVVISIPKPGDVTIEVSNMVGQTLSAKTYKNLSAGKNYLTVDCTDYAAGLYVYKVKTGTEVISSTMSVK